MKEARTPHMQFSPHLAQHQGYMPYVHGPYAYSHGYEPNHPGYRGMPSVMMQNYPGRNHGSPPQASHDPAAQALMSVVLLLLYNV